MLTIIYPGTINWFYKHQAKLLQEDLTRCGLAVRSMLPKQIAASDDGVGVALILSYWECATEAERDGLQKPFMRAMSSFDRRVLLNYDSLLTHYFQRHFAVGSARLTEIVDVCMAPQTYLDHVNSLPYIHVPEAFSVAELSLVEPWSARRPVPWAMLGHANTARIALAALCQESISPSGVVFMPPIRPFTSESGMEREAIHRLLRRTDLYIWGSHHSGPYHEGLRALHAVAAGAVPCKIDPLHYRKFARIPWVYGSVAELLRERDRFGLDELYGRARSHLEANGTIGALLMEVLHLDEGQRLSVSKSGLRTRHVSAAQLS